MRESRGTHSPNVASSLLKHPDAVPRNQKPEGGERIPSGQRASFGRPARLHQDRARLRGAACSRETQVQRLHCDRVT